MEDKKQVEKSPKDEGIKVTKVGTTKDPSAEAIAAAKKKGWTEIKIDSHGNLHCGTKIHTN